MSNPKFTLEDAVIVQKHLRLRARMTQPISQDVTTSYEIVESVLGRMTEKTWRVGHYVAECGQLKPIPGAISKYVDGKGVVEIPLNTEPEPERTLRPVSIQALCEADGDVTAAESHDENDFVVEVESEEPCFDVEVEAARAMQFDPETIPDREQEEENLESTDSESGSDAE